MLLLLVPAREEPSQYDQAKRQPSDPLWYKDAVIYELHVMAFLDGNGERIAQGRDKACPYLAEHPALAAELRDKLIALRKAESSRLGAPAPVVGGESEAA